MKAEITEKGCLVISAESPIEAYALKKYSVDWEAREASILISYDGEFLGSVLSLHDSNTAES